jgi:hypothetical protein
VGRTGYRVGVSSTAGVPSDNTTLSAVLAEFAAAGHDGQFEVVAADGVCCVACSGVSAPAEYHVAAWRRLEGASDPDDMLSVVAVTCPSCDRRGALVLGFGPTAAADEAAVGRGLREATEGDSPPPATPPAG